MFETEETALSPVDKVRRAAMAMGQGLQPNTLNPANMAPPDVSTPAGSPSLPRFEPQNGPLDVQRAPVAPGPAMLDPQDPKYTSLAPHGMKKAGLVAASLVGGPITGLAERSLYAPEIAYKKDMEAQNQQVDVAGKLGDVSLHAAQGEEARQRGNALELNSGDVMVTRTNPDGTTVSVPIPRKDAQKYYTGVDTNTTRKDMNADTNKTREEIAADKRASDERIASGKNLTSTDITKMKNDSAERISTGKNLTATEVARIRADAANDPNKLTNTMKTMKQQAQATLPKLDAALDETEKVADLLGPGAGRWNDFWQGKVGAGDPRYAHYKDNIGMVSSAVTLTHARGRMSNELFEHFEKMFDAGKQSPENMIQAINVAKDWLSDYAAMGEVGSSVPPSRSGGGGGTVIKYDAQGNRVK